MTPPTWPKLKPKYRHVHYIDWLIANIFIWAYWREARSQLAILFTIDSDAKEFLINELLFLW